MKNADLKNKHNHALTQWLKVGIFSLLMLAPLIASVSQWIYATVNKNAKDSYSQSSLVEKTSTYKNATTLVEDEIYTLKLDDNITENVQFIFYKNISIDWEDYNIPANTYIGFCLYGDSYPLTYLLAYGTPADYQYYYSPITTNNVDKFTFTYETASHTTTFNGYELINYQYQKATLDNAFYYGVDQMTKSELFNWTQNTAIYSGIKGMTDNLEIGTPAIAILITYWTILTIAYVIIDILITGFTWITHLIVRND